MLGSEESIRLWTVAHAIEDRLQGISGADPRNPPSAGDLLGASLWDPSPEVRQRAAERLREAPAWPRLRSLLTEPLGGPDGGEEPGAARSDMRRWFEELSDLADCVTPSGPARAAVAWHPDPRAREIAAELLLELRDRGAARAVVRSLESAPGRQIEQALGRLITELDLGEAVVEAWRTGIAEVPSFLVTTLRESSSGAAFRVLRTALAEAAQIRQKWAGTLHLRHQTRLTPQERAQALRDAAYHDWLLFDEETQGSLIDRLASSSSYPRCNEREFADFLRVVADAPQRLRPLVERLLPRVAGMPWCLLREREGQVLPVAPSEQQRQVSLAVEQLATLEARSSPLMLVRSRDLVALLTVARRHPEAVALGKRVLEVLGTWPKHLRYGPYCGHKTLRLRTESAYSALLLSTAGPQAVLAELEDPSGITVRTGVQCEVAYTLVQSGEYDRLISLGPRLCTRARKLALHWARANGELGVAARMEDTWGLRVGEPARSPGRVAAELREHAEADPAARFVLSHERDPRQARYGVLLADEGVANPEPEFHWFESAEDLVDFVCLDVTRVALDPALRSGTRCAERADELKDRWASNRSGADSLEGTEEVLRELNECLSPGVTRVRWLGRFEQLCREDTPIARFTRKAFWAALRAQEGSEFPSPTGADPVPRHRRWQFAEHVSGAVLGQAPPAVVLPGSLVVQGAEPIRMVLTWRKGRREADVTVIDLESREIYESAATVRPGADLSRVLLEELKEKAGEYLGPSVTPEGVSFRLGPATEYPEDELDDFDPEREIAWDDLQTASALLPRGG